MYKYEKTETKKNPDVKEAGKIKYIKKSLKDNKLTKEKNKKKNLINLLVTI